MAFRASSENTTRDEIVSAAAAAWLHAGMPVDGVGWRMTDLEKLSGMSRTSVNRLFTSADIQPLALTEAAKQIEFDVDDVLTGTLKAVLSSRRLDAGESSRDAAIIHYGNHVSSLPHHLQLAKLGMALSDPRYLGAQQRAARLIAAKRTPYLYVLQTTLANIHNNFGEQLTPQPEPAAYALAFDAVAAATACSPFAPVSPARAGDMYRAIANEYTTKMA